jgi:hypothetical protein
VHSPFPFISLVETALVASDLSVTNTTQLYRQIPCDITLSEGRHFSAKVEFAAMLEVPRGQAGSYVIGWAIHNNTGTASTIRFGGSMSVKKYTEDMKSFDPSR